MTWRGVLVCVAALALALPAHADDRQQGDETQPPPVQVPQDDPDLDPSISQPDFTIVNLPTTLRVPRHSSAFRVTHRFGRPLGQGSFGELVEDLFGLDSGALIGLEYRFGLMRGLQVGILRTSDRTIGFFGHYNVLQQNEARPLGVGIVASMDGTNNFRDTYSPALGVVLSRELGDRGAVYLQPFWVHHTSVPPAGGADDTLVLGLGARLRVRPTVYLVGEFMPRAGHTPGPHHGTFGIERRAGGHVFQLNVSNGHGNTVAQLARGGTIGGDWYIGFNISRKFFR